MHLEGKRDCMHRCMHVGLASLWPGWPGYLPRLCGCSRASLTLDVLVSRPVSPKRSVQQRRDLRRTDRQQPGMPGAAHQHRDRAQCSRPSDGIHGVLLQPMERGQPAPAGNMVPRCGALGPVRAEHLAADAAVRPEGRTINLPRGRHDPVYGSARRQVTTATPANWTSSGRVPRRLCRRDAHGSVASLRRCHASRQWDAQREGNGATVKVPLGAGLACGEWRFALL